MTNHKVGTREEWQAARDELLKEEKELTRHSDELARPQAGSRSGCGFLGRTAARRPARAGQ